jgi:hypothetical protein
MLSKCNVKISIYQQVGGNILCDIVLMGENSALL